MEPGYYQPALLQQMSLLVTLLITRIILSWTMLCRLRPHSMLLFLNPVKLRTNNSLQFRSRLRLNIQDFNAAPLNCFVSPDILMLWLEQLRQLLSMTAGAAGAADHCNCWCHQRPTAAQLLCISVSETLSMYHDSTCLQTLLR